MTEFIVPKEYNLERDCELRFEIESKMQVVVEVNKVFIKSAWNHVLIAFVAQVWICGAVWHGAR